MRSFARILPFVAAAGIAGCGGGALGESGRMSVKEASPVECAWDAVSTRWSCNGAVRVTVDSAPSDAQTLHVSLQTDLLDGTIEADAALPAQLGDVTVPLVTAQAACHPAMGFAQKITAMLEDGSGGSVGSTSAYNVALEVRCTGGP